MMKKMVLVLAAVAVVGFCTPSAEAGRYYRRAVRGVRVAPVVRVRPVYVAPVVRPVYVQRPAYIYDYGYYRPRTSVIVGGGPYYYGGGVQVRVPGFGLNVRY